MAFSQESIRSLISHQIIPIPANTYMVWGVISSIMMGSSIILEHTLDTVLVISFGCLVGMFFTWWDISRINATFDLFNFNSKQKDILIILSLSLIFSIFLTIILSNEEIYIYIYPIWAFTIGNFNYIVGSLFSKRLIFSYGIFLISVAFILLIGIIAFNIQSNREILNTFAIINIVLIGAGHILIGIYYKTLGNKNVK